MTNIFITDDKIQKIIEELFKEKNLSPMLDKNDFISFVKAGIQELDENCGCFINYDEDFKARELLKLYVLYSSKNLLHEFKKDYMGDYVNLQIKYNANTNL